MPTNRTHQASASLRLRATPPATRVSRIERSPIRSRVITGTLRVVNTFISSPHLAPQATLRRKWRSVSRAMRTRSSRVSSRNRSIRAERAAARAAPDVALVSSTSGSCPTTRISSPSALTSGGPTNQPAGIRVANQARTSSAIDYKSTGRTLSGFGLSCRLLGSRPERLQAVHHDLGPVALLTCGVLPGVGLEPAVDVHEPALVEVLPDELGRLPKSHQVVELRLLPGVAALVLAHVRVGGKPNLGDVRPLGRRLDIGVR